MSKNNANIIEFTVKIDFNYPMQNADSDPFRTFRRGDWENYFREQMIEKMESLEFDNGADIEITDENGEQVV